ncbi:hypothetical protein C7477_107106 [Phyllobacterium leguminum]|uniref:Uncharacterized protein n=1 Tax=Phyllobacterium leguminum TaxID=314237 RepID=A0A318T3E5_9HYPH|nr:hypothetical protein C7477_107106 [Phyllobacterium leguminum]
MSFTQFMAFMVGPIGALLIMAVMLFITRKDRAKNNSKPRQSN